MAEITTPAQAVVVDYQCDDCGEGKMIPTGVVLLSLPPQYPHTCNKCGKQKSFRERYPTTRIVEQKS